MVSIPAGSSLGRYRIVERVGRGGMATVFRAHDPALGRDVAIKVLSSHFAEDPSFVARFTLEAQTAARLGHPNILRVHDVGEDKGFTYIVMELLPGGTLRDRLQGEPISLEETLELVAPLAEGLDYAHSQGIIHRDLKPSNVLLDAESRPILADFGLARALEGSAHLTHTQQTVGTPAYMSPEQALGGEVDHRTDLYSLGIVVYEMLLGRTPFHGETPGATLLAQIHRPPPPPRSVSPDLDPRVEAVILASLDKNPDNRCQSASELVQLLALAAGRTPEGATEVLSTTGLDSVERKDFTGAQVGPDRTTVAPGTSRVGLRLRGRARWLVSGAALAAAAVAVLVSALVILVGDSAPEQVDAQPSADIAIEKAVAAMEALMSPTRQTPALADLLELPKLAGTPQPRAPAGQAQGGISLEKALGALGALERTRARAAPTEPIAETTSRAERNVTELRVLSAGPGIEAQERTAEQMASIARRLFTRRYLHGEASGTEELYKALGLIDEDTSLKDLLAQVRLARSYALFDDEADTLYVLSGPTTMGSDDELAYAAAYTAALQQQRFDVAEVRRRAREAGSDPFRAAVGLIGGDVFQIQKGYQTMVLAEDQGDEMAGALSETGLRGVPGVVRKVALFPHREGGEFVARLFSSVGSWESVNEAYTLPPASTEQILHVEKYLDSEEPALLELSDFSARIGEGWTQVRADTLGEFFIRTYLEQHLDASRASPAAAGWGGDSYSVLRGPAKERVLISLVAWDSVEDSVEFFEAYQLFAETKYRGLGAGSKLGDTVWKWVTGDETAFLGQNGPTTLLIIGDNELLIARVLELLAAS